MRNMYNLQYLYACMREFMLLVVGSHTALCAFSTLHFSVDSWAWPVIQWDILKDMYRMRKYASMHVRVISFLSLNFSFSGWEHFLFFTIPTQAQASFHIEWEREQLNWLLTLVFPNGYSHAVLKLGCRYPDTHQKLKSKDSQFSLLRNYS